MVISIKFGQKVSYLLSRSGIENAIGKVKRWARSYTPPPVELTPNQARRAEAMAKNPDRVPFCHQYWAKMQSEGALRPYPYRVVENHGQFNSFNYLFVKGRVNYGFDSPAFAVGDGSLMIKDVIRQSDIQFKRLRPTEEPVTVYRCIGEKPPFMENDAKLYKKLFDAKKGDIITMPEYAYAAGGTEYSDVYKGYEGRGVTMEIFVDKGARVSHSGDIVDGKLDNWGAECVFPRGSRLEVFDSKVLEDGSCYKKVKYILPDEPWRTQT